MNVDNINNLLNRKRDLIDTRKLSYEEEKKILERIKSTLSNLIDFDFLYKQINIMKINQNAYSKKTYNRERFNDAKDKIIEIREKLRDIGLESAGINEIISANYNRPDRDDLSLIEEENILDIMEFKQ